MRPTDDIAAVVRANSFQLIDPSTGLVAGNLSSQDIAAKHYAELVLLHQAAMAADSRLQWSVDGTHTAQFARTSLIGPTALGPSQSPPQLILTTDVTGAPKESTSVLTSGVAGVGGSGHAGAAALVLDSGRNSKIGTNEDAGEASLSASNFGQGASVLVAVDNVTNTSIDLNALTLNINAGSATLLNSRPIAYVIGIAGTAIQSVSGALGSGSTAISPASAALGLTFNDYAMITAQVSLRANPFTTAGDVFVSLIGFLNGVAYLGTGFIGAPVAHWVPFQAFDTVTIPLTYIFGPIASPGSWQFEVSGSYTTAGGGNVVVSEANGTAISVTAYALQ